MKKFRTIGKRSVIAVLCLISVLFSNIISAVYPVVDEMGYGLGAAEETGEGGETEIFSTADGVTEEEPEHVEADGSDGHESEPAAEDVEENESETAETPAETSEEAEPPVLSTGGCRRNN